MTGSMKLPLFILSHKKRNNTHTLTMTRVHEPFNLPHVQAASADLAGPGDLASMAWLKRHRTLWSKVTRPGGVFSC